MHLSPGTPPDAAKPAGKPLRWLLPVVVATLPLLAIAASLLGWGDRLPDPIPSHWGRAGRVTDTASLAGFVTVITVLTSTAAAVALFGAVATLLPRTARRALVGAGAAASTFAAGVWLVTAGLVLDLADPRQAPSPTWHLLVLLGGSAAAGVVAFALTPALPPEPATGVPAAHLPRADTRGLDTAPWRERLILPRTLLLLPALLVVLTAVVAGAAADPWLASPILVIAVLTAPLSTGWLVIDRGGLRAGFGPWGWPWVRVPVTQIVSAETTDIQVEEWGGWGWRTRADLGRAVITGSGRGVRVSLPAGRYVVVSTGHPETVAGLLNTLAEQSRTIAVAPSGS